MVGNIPDPEFQPLSNSPRDCNGRRRHGHK
jgi:hypothetical protein